MNAPVSSPGFRWRRRHFFGVAVVLLVLAIVVPPYISVNRFRRSIVQSISAGLGRSVEASSVRLQLFPRPGFVLHNLTVAEDPTYGAEPVMMAQTVTASLRASTLWHRRVEIATLRFDAPSVNLVRSPGGHWNFESLLRNSPALHMHSGSNHAAARMPFPYVEATEARINFKLGPEKLPFSLEDASLALWKESGHEWRLRLRANPARTDLTLRDTGQIRGRGTLITGGALMDARVRGRLEWRRVQLDEIGRLLHGDDDGWRGTVDWTTETIGTLSDVSATSDIAIDNFHRAEFIPHSEMDFSIHCQGRYARHHAALNALACVAPADGGEVWLRGFQFAKTAVRGPILPADKGTRHRVSLHLPLTIHPVRPRVQISLKKVPAGFLLDVLGHIHPGVPPEASASGQVNGEAECAWRGLEMPTACTGEFHAKSVRLQLPQLGHPMAFSQVRIESPATPDLPASPPGWTLSPARVSLGGPTEATIEGRVRSTGVSLQIDGPADLRKLDRLAQSLRLPAFSGEVQSLRGSAQLALTLESNWVVQSGDDSGESAASSAATGPGMNAEPAGTLPRSLPSRWLGSVELHHAAVQLAALPVPIELVSGEIVLSPHGVQWTALNGIFARIPFDGSVRWQTPCPVASSPCVRGFALHTANLDVERLQKALRTRSDSGSLLNRINPWATGAAPLPAISGVFRADALSLDGVFVKDAVVQVRLDGRSARLMGISGKIFGGTIAGPATGDDAGWARWGGDAPAYALRVRLAHIQADDLGALWREHWGGGGGDAVVEVQTHGQAEAELAGNASGMFAFDWKDGTLAATGRVPIRFSRWNATGTIGDRRLKLDSSRMIVRGASSKPWFRQATQSVSGSVSFVRALDLRLEPSGVSISGPLDSTAVPAPQP